MVKHKLNGLRKKQRNKLINSASMKELPPSHWAYAVAALPGKSEATAQEARK